MPRKTFAHPDAVSGRVGMAVMKIQQVHYGHTDILNRMLCDCDTVILGIGSTQLHGVVGHPYTAEQKQDQIRSLYGPLVKMVPLQDIDSSENTDEWWAYVHQQVIAYGLPEPTDYFTGSKVDAKWYTNAFARFDDPAEVNGPWTTYASARTGKRLHILDRTLRPELQATEIRSLIELRDPEWRRSVPAKLHRYVERNYPPHLRQVIRGADFPEDVPIGTRFLKAGDGSGTVYELKPDLKWRPRSDRSGARTASTA